MPRHPAPISNHAPGPLEPHAGFLPARLFGVGFHPDTGEIRVNPAISSEFRPYPEELPYVNDGIKFYKYTNL